ERSVECRRRVESLWRTRLHSRHGSRRDCVVATSIDGRRPAIHGPYVTPGQAGLGSWDGATWIRTMAAMRRAHRTVLLVGDWRTSPTRYCCTTSPAPSPGRAV